MKHECEALKRELDKLGGLGQPDSFYIEGKTFWRHDGEYWEYQEFCEIEYCPWCGVKLDGN